MKTKLLLSATLCAFAFSQVVQSAPPAKKTAPAKSAAPPPIVRLRANPVDETNAVDVSIGEQLCTLKKSLVAESDDADGHWGRYTIPPNTTLLLDVDGRAKRILACGNNLRNIAVEGSLIEAGYCNIHDITLPEPEIRTIREPAPPPQIVREIVREVVREPAPPPPTPAPKPAPTLTVEPKTVEVAPGKSFELKAYFDPDGPTGPQAAMDVTTDKATDYRATSDLVAPDKKRKNKFKAGKKEGQAALGASYGGASAAVLVTVKKSAKGGGHALRNGIIAGGVATAMVIITGVVKGWFGGKKKANNNGPPCYLYPGTTIAIPGCNLPPR